MNFSFGSEVAELDAGTLAFLEKANGVARLRCDGDDPVGLWPDLAAVGLLGLTAGAGGLGLPLGDALRICRSFGYSNLPEPVGETVALVIPLLDRLLPDDGRVAELVQGKIRIALSHPLNPCVNLLQGSDELMVIRPGRTALYATEKVRAREVRSVDPWRQLSVIETLPAPSLILAEGASAQEIHDASAQVGAIEAAEELCGLARRMIELATDYAKGRRQFGQPIGSFQAVKHLLANAQVELEFALPVVDRAGADVPSDLTRVYAAHAKVAATDAAILAGETAIQIFGGMGYTYEADLHYFLKRVWALAGNWGSKEHHLIGVEQALMSGRMDIGPDSSFPSDKCN